MGRPQVWSQDDEPGGCLLQETGLSVVRACHWKGRAKGRFQRIPEDWINGSRDGTYVGCERDGGVTVAPSVLDRAMVERWTKLGKLGSIF